MYINTTQKGKLSLNIFNFYLSSEPNRKRPEEEPGDSHHLPFGKYRTSKPPKPDCGIGQQYIYKILSMSFMQSHGSGPPAPQEGSPKQHKVSPGRPKMSH